jgi:hypothetical protein
MELEHFFTSDGVRGRKVKDEGIRVEDDALNADLGII